MIVAVTGGRDHWPTGIILTELADLFSRRGVVEVRHGGATGVDQSVAAALRNTFRVVEYPAPWDRFGRSAGPIRNAGMLQGWLWNDLLGWQDYGPMVEELFAFPGGRGTADCKRKARELGIRVTEIS